MREREAALHTPPQGSYKVFKPQGLETLRASKGGWQVATDLRGGLLVTASFPLKGSGGRDCATVYSALYRCRKLANS